MARVIRAEVLAAIRRRRHERQRALRQPDFFTEGGEVHPIRASAGYSELEERAHERERGRRRAHEAARESYQAGIRLADAGRSYRELQDHILSEGGIRPDRDYPSDAIPRDVRRHGGKPADEMVRPLSAHGWHYDDAEELLADLRRRRRRLEALGVLQRA